VRRWRGEICGWVLGDVRGGGGGGCTAVVSSDLKKAGEDGSGRGKGNGEGQERHTAFCAGYCLASAMWSLESLMGRESRAVRNCFAKESSVILAAGFETL
jgi:hypothetical protein